jgi:hypothetical protein
MSKSIISYLIDHPKSKNAIMLVFRQSFSDSAVTFQEYQSFSNVLWKGRQL